MLRLLILAVCITLFLSSAFALDCIDIFDRRLPENFLNVPPVAQTTNVTCGPACFGAVLEFLGVRAPSEAKLSELLNTTYEGTADYSIIRLAREYGFTAWMKRGTTLADLERYVRQKKAIIVTIRAWGEGHWVVVVGIDNNYVYVMDPWKNRRYRRIERARFKTYWADPSDRNYKNDTIIIGKGRSENAT